MAPGSVGLLVQELDVHALGSSLGLSSSPLGCQASPKKLRNEWLKDKLEENGSE